MADCPCNFPKQVPFDCVKDLAGMLTGSVAKSVPLALEHAGCILGCAGVLIDPAVAATALTAASPALTKACTDPGNCSDAELAVALESCFAPQGNQDPKGFIIPWTLVIPLVINVIQRIAGMLFPSA